MRNPLAPILVAGVLFASSCLPVAAADPDPEDVGKPPFSDAHLRISLHADGRVEAQLMTFVKTQRKQSVRDDTDWTAAMERFFGSPVTEENHSETPMDKKYTWLQRHFAVADGVRHDGWLNYLDVDPEPLLAVFRKTAARTLYLHIMIDDAQGFSECTLTAPPPREMAEPEGDDPEPGNRARLARARMQRARTSGSQTGWPFQRMQFYSYELPVAGEPVPPFRVAYGYRPVSPWTLAPLALLPLPVLLTLWRRRRALGQAEADSTQAWWGYTRFARRLEVGLALFWAFLFVGTPGGVFLDQLVHSALGLSTSGQTFFVGWDWLSLAVYAVPPAVIGFLCAYLAYPVYVRVRKLEWTRWDMVWHALFGHVLNWFSLLLLAAALAAALNADIHRAVGWGFVFFLVRVLLPQLRASARQRALQPLDNGVVRDRVFELARLAGVKMNQVYLWQTKHDRSANAAAAVGNKVLITDYLLQNMSKRQVDYIVAHELAHLRHRHPGAGRRGGGLVWVVIVLIYMAFFVGQNAVEGVPEVQPVFETLFQCKYGFLLALLLGMTWSDNFRKRRNEFVADGDAVAIVGGDVEAAVQALVKLARLNAQPEQWDRLDAGLLTHPSQSRRIQAILDENDVDPARLPAILATVDRDEDRYPLPTDALQDERALLAEYKGRRSLAVSLFSLGLFMLLPALLARVLDSQEWEGAMRWAAFGGGIVLSLVVLTVATGYSVVWGERRFRTQFAALCKSAGFDVEARHGVFVALAPARVPRLYESTFDWDFGFLFPAGDRLCYVGCQARFAVPFNRIKTLRIGRGAPRWGKSTRVYLTWCDDRGTETTWNLRPAGAINLRQMQGRVPHLLRTLEEWRQGATSAGIPPEPVASLAAPAIGQVTTTTLASYLRMNPLRRSIGLFVLGSAGLAYLFGCSFGLFPLPGLDEYAPWDGFPSPGWGWYAPALTCLMVVFQRIPWWLHREPPLPKELSIPYAELANGAKDPARFSTALPPHSPSPVVAEDRGGGVRESEDPPHARFSGQSA
jgi:Zn-dependent protease with chaperone function